MYTNKVLFCKFRALFLQNQGTFLLFPKKGMKDFPHPPTSCAPPILFFLAYFSILLCNSSIFACTKSQLNLHVLTQLLENNCLAKIDMRWLNYLMFSSIIGLDNLWFPLHLFNSVKVILGDQFRHFISRCNL